MSEGTGSAQDSATARTRLVIALLLAAGVATALGVLGRSAQANAYATLPTFGFSDATTFKTWLATIVLVLALAQMVTAMALYGRFPWLRPLPRWVSVAHRASGGIAFVVSLPVAAYCLYAFGFSPDPTDPRTLVHSVAGCAFYGAFAAKVLLVHTRRLPGWALPLAGGALLTAVVLIWLTSALWWFRLSGVHA